MSPVTTPAQHPTFSTLLSEHFFHLSEFFSCGVVAGWFIITYTYTTHHCTIHAKGQKIRGLLSPPVKQH